MRKVKFTLEERIQIAREYKESDISRKEICQKYGIANHNNVSTWLNRYLVEGRYPKKYISLLSRTKKEPAEMSPRESLSPIGNNNDPEELLARISRLEKSLEWEKMRVHALETMIDIAEEQGMPVRKKSGAKR